MKNTNTNDIITIRKGCKDIWNAFMVRGATFTENDIPCCPTTAYTLPDTVISYDEAKQIHKKTLRNGQTNYFINSFIHFWIDDYKFDGIRTGIWAMPFKALTIIKHFSGIITPDFSTNSDYPEPIKKYNTYRMRAFGFWISNQNIPVINNVRWGTEETWSYCWDGIPQNSIIAIGAAASGLKKSINRPLFEVGLQETVKQLRPSAIIIYGAPNYPIFDTLRKQNIVIKTFHSKMDLAFSKELPHE